MDVFNKIAVRIIKEQALIIGPLAWHEAQKVQGLKIVDETKEQINFNANDPKLVIDGLVNQYEKLFGKASHEVCRDAVVSILAELSPNEIPLSLR